MKPIAYIIGALLIVILLQFIITQCERRKHDRELQAYQTALDSCMNAEPERDTLWQFATLRDTIRLPFTYRVTDRDTVRDTVIERREYRGNYTTDLLAVRWRAVVFGRLDSIEILPSSTYRYPQITETIRVALPARECEPVKLSRERSHWYATADVMAGDGVYIRVGLQYVHRGGWGLQGGIMSNGERLLYGGGFALRLK
jgi:hypothetical protein